MIFKCKHSDFQENTLKFVMIWCYELWKVILTLNK